MTTRTVSSGSVSSGASQAAVHTASPGPASPGRRRRALRVRARPRVLERLGEREAEGVHEEGAQRVAVADAGPVLGGADDHVLHTLLRVRGGVRGVLDTLHTHGTHRHVHTSYIPLHLPISPYISLYLRGCLDGLELDLEEPLERGRGGGQHRERVVPAPRGEHACAAWVECAPGWGSRWGSGWGVGAEGRGGDRWRRAHMLSAVTCGQMPPPSRDPSEISSRSGAPSPAGAATSAERSAPPQKIFSNLGRYRGDIGRYREIFSNLESKAVVRGKHGHGKLFSRMGDEDKAGARVRVRAGMGLGVG